MKKELRVSRPVAAAQILAFCALGYVGAILIRAGLGSELFVTYIVGGSLAIVFAIICVTAIIEALSTRVNQDGVEQTRFFYRGKFLVRGHLAWDEVKICSHRRLTYRLKSEKFEARLNVTAFSDSNELVDFLQENLTEATISASLTSALAPIRPNVIGRWVCVVTTFLAGLWLAVEVRVNQVDIPMHVLGMLLGTASAIWARRVLECSSVRMDAQGLDQLKVFDRGEFFVNRRLEWINVTKASTFLATYKLESYDLCIRVDASYFVENEDVALFVDRHLPKGLHRDA